LAALTAGVAQQISRSNIQKKLIICGLVSLFITRMGFWWMAVHESPKLIINRDDERHTFSGNMQCVAIHPQITLLNFLLLC
jgi:hypothetical protein